MNSKKALDRSVFLNYKIIPPSLLYETWSTTPTNFATFSSYVFHVKLISDNNPQMKSCKLSYSVRVVKRGWGEIFYNVFFWIQTVSSSMAVSMTSWHSSSNMFQSLYYVYHCGIWVYNYCFTNIWYSLCSVRGCPSLPLTFTNEIVGSNRSLRSSPARGSLLIYLLWEVSR